MKQMLLLTSNASGGGEPSAPVMALIIFLCLASPYLIRRFTGKSLGEWFGSITLLGRLAKKKEQKEQAEAAKSQKEKRAAASNGGSGKSLAERAGVSHAGNVGASVSGKSGGTASRASGGSNSSGGKSAPSDSAAVRAAQNEYLKFLADVLNFARKNQLFVAMPGTLKKGGAQTDFTLVLITKCRVIGVMAHAEHGKVTSYPLPETEGNLLLLQQITDALYGAHLPCEAFSVYTASSVSFGPGKPKQAVNTEQFFARVRSDQDLKTGSVDARAFGKRMRTVLVKGKR